MPNISKLAQKIAALVKESPLDMARKSAALRADEASRMARADEMFPVNAYRGASSAWPNLEEEIGPLEDIASRTRFNPEKTKSWTVPPNSLLGRDVAWFSDSTDVANSYGRALDWPRRRSTGPRSGFQPGAGIVPVRLRLGESLAIDANKEDWHEIRSSGLFDAVPTEKHSELLDALRQVASGSWKGHEKYTWLDPRSELHFTKPNRRNMFDLPLTTNDVANLAHVLGYESAAIANVYDRGYQFVKRDRGKFGPKTSYAILNPANIRSRFAQFDPAKRDSIDWMAAVIPPMPVGALAYGQQQSEPQRSGALSKVTK